MANSSQACADVIPVPVLSDNFAYLLIDRATRKAACVDPAEPEKKANVTVEMGICTHKHLDHSGGNERIAQLIPGIRIVGSAYEYIPGITDALKDRQTINLGSLNIEAFHTPCHTEGHELFYVTSSQESCPILFTGDTLFVGGCGRFFEGDANQMLKAMSIIASLPGETKIYCGHEYTISNLKFALSVEPSNVELRNKYEWACREVELGRHTIPSSVKEELSFNPFMRVKEDSVRRSITNGESMTDEQVMATLREMKNNFKG